MIKVSVIIPVYNAEKTLRQTLESALSQRSGDIELEIIVVNDGSTDGSAGVLETYHDRCRIITTVNKGVSEARTTGLFHATGTYVQYLDSDDLLAPGKIRRQAEALMLEEADLAYGDWEKFYEQAGEKTVTEIVSKQLQPDAVLDIYRGFWCPPAALLFSRELTAKLKWRYWLPVIQDARYLLDAAMINAKIIYTPGVQASYRVQQKASLSKRDPFAFVLDCYKNTQHLYERHWRGELDHEQNKKEAIIASLRYCIIEFSTTSRSYWKRAIRLLLKVSPGYIPPEPGLHKTLSRLVGFANAERMAAIKRRLLK